LVFSGWWQADCRYHLALPSEILLAKPNKKGSYHEHSKNDRPNEWASLKTIDNPPVDMRGTYVLRPRLSWTGLYGKEPWPRERKQWEKV
jgi:hypothetical protein